MRGYDNMGFALFVVFAIWQTLWSTAFFCLYVAAWIVSAPRGTSLIAFMDAHEFAAWYLVSTVIASILTGVVGVVAWVGNAKSAKDRGSVERLVDAWVAKMSRNDR